MPSRETLVLAKSVIFGLTTGAGFTEFQQKPRLPGTPSDALSFNLLLRGEVTWAVQSVSQLGALVFGRALKLLLCQ